MYAFFMKNRFHWTDRVEQTITADEAVDARLREIMSHDK
jgi:predicted DCC family thiol-disulfide oxidoreductase YuxK